MKSIGSSLVKIGMALTKDSKKVGENQYVSSLGSDRVIRLSDGDAALILKENGKSICVGSGKTELKKNEELLFIVMLYLSNQDFVNLLYQLYQDSVDKARSEQFKDGVSTIRGSNYEK
jgi:hypothetical protein